MNAEYYRQSPDSPSRISILVGRDLHCLRQLLNDVSSGVISANIQCVISNHTDAEAMVKGAGLCFEHNAATNLTAHLTWLMERLDNDNPDFIVLARYMRILPPALVRKYPQRIVGIHPTLEPHFSSERPYHAAFESGVRLHGCTAHFVTEQLDEGPIIAQDVFPIDVGRDGVAQIREKALNLEAQTLSAAVQQVLAGKITVQDGKCVYTDISRA